MPEHPVNLSFPEQIAFFAGKINLATATWRDIWQAQHDRAFVVAGAAKAELLDDFRGAVDEAVREGTGYAAFREKFDEIVERHGWSYNGSPGWRSRVIYRTNMQTSRQAGRFQQQKQIADRRPFWMYNHSDFVEEPREDHLSWDGTVLRHDNPWWDTHYAPNGWGCKCWISSLSPRDVERRGLTVAEQGPDDRIDPATGAPEGIDEGWAYTPGRSVTDDRGRLVEQTAARLSPAVRELFQDEVADSPPAGDPPDIEDL